MYIVIELQTTNGVTAVVPPTAYADLSTAYQKYYTILAAAAVSSVSVHSAVILNERGELVRTESFEHAVEEPAVEE